MGSNDGNSGSLIDFNVDSGTPAAAVSAQEIVSQQTNSPPVESVDWTCFDLASQQKPPQATTTTTNANLLESVFNQLSIAGTSTASNVPTSPVLAIDDRLAIMIQNSEAVVSDVDIFPANTTSSASNNPVTFDLC